ncbi:hypothetical protein PHYBOEH_001554 [Phytophthora boehmeriae]|uniref:RxLR effector protein n=1 Tax=Phytophthora boehmeriae TaxID=109152 RepID=A0A8T1WZE6_9STRA|nr:hypothetical protein PHYBOEH_001554 [Phytophthora boehmeriae]
MRLLYLLLVASTTLHASMDAASAIQDVGHHPLSEISAPTVVWSTDVGREEGNGNRFLRNHETEEDDEEEGKEDSDKEERAGALDYLKVVWARVFKMRETKELAKLEKQNSAQIRNLKSELESIKESGWDIKSLGKRFKIGDKLKTMTPAQLRKDGEYVLWVQFATFLKNRPLPAPV